MSKVSLLLGIDQIALTDPRKSQRRVRRSKSTSMAQIEGQNAQPRISTTYNCYKIIWRQRKQSKHILTWTEGS